MSANTRSVPRWIRDVRFAAGMDRDAEAFIPDHLHSFKHDPAFQRDMTLSYKNTLRTNYRAPVKNPALAVAMVDREALKEKVVREDYRMEWLAEKRRKEDQEAALKIRAEEEKEKSLLALGGSSSGSSSDGGGAPRGGGDPTANLLAQIASSSEEEVAAKPAFLKKKDGTVLGLGYGLIGPVIQVGSRICSSFHVTVCLVEKNWWGFVREEANRGHVGHVGQVGQVGRVHLSQVGHVGHV